MIKRTLGIALLCCFSLSMAGCLNPIRTVENSINGAVRIGTTVRNLVPDKPKPEEEKKEPGEGASR
ncbi:MAG: hypothetical protein KDD64_15855, partial [Bdellovibrionales bacterium]|nr:hypothetical protein [Bdellovibrionales bacterium]